MKKDLELINEIADYIAASIQTPEGTRVETIVDMVREFDARKDNVPARGVLPPDFD